jgi:uncharacterized protein (DUF2237 family)
MEYKYKTSAEKWECLRDAALNVLGDRELAEKCNKMIRRLYREGCDGDYIDFGFGAVKWDMTINDYDDFIMCAVHWHVIRDALKNCMMSYKGCTEELHDVIRHPN